MKRFKTFFRFDKEEKWLEHMEAQGWLLYKVSGFYYFQRIHPEVKRIRIDYRIFKSEKDFADYSALFEDSGWQHIAGTKTSGTQYFLKVHEDSTEDIFSDIFSKAGRYKRLSNIWLRFTIPFVLLLAAMIIGGWVNFDMLFTPKEWYLTPGLWELRGLSFYRSFLFETPFALLRGLAWIIPVITILLYGGFALKSRLLYYSAIKNERQ